MRSEEAERNMSVRKERTTKEMKKNQGMDGVLFSALASIGGHHGVTIGVERSL